MAVSHDVHAGTRGPIGEIEQQRAQRPRRVQSILVRVLTAPGEFVAGLVTAPHGFGHLELRQMVSEFRAEVVLVGRG